MLISTVTVLALRCPSCGRLEFRGLSLFDFSGGCNMQVKCSCGTVLVSGRKKGKNFLLQYHCLMCDGYHKVHYHCKELWSKELKVLTCVETGLEVGFIGSREKVRRAVQEYDRSLAEMAEDLGVNDFFEEPEVMYQLLSLVYQMTESGNVSCGCGNKNIVVEIFPGHLQLRCEVCSAEKILPAASRDDLEQAKALQDILLSGSLPKTGEFNPRKGWRRGRRKSPV